MAVCWPLYPFICLVRCTCIMWYHVQVHVPLALIRSPISTFPIPPIRIRELSQQNQAISSHVVPTNSSRPSVCCTVNWPWSTNMGSSSSKASCSSSSLPPLPPITAGTWVMHDYTVLKLLGCGSVPWVLSENSNYTKCYSCSLFCPGAWKYRCCHIEGYNVLLLWVDCFSPFELLE